MTGEEDLSADCPTFSTSANSLAAGGFITLLDGQTLDCDDGFSGSRFVFTRDTVGDDLRLANLPDRKRNAPPL